MASEAVYLNPKDALEAELILNKIDTGRRFLNLGDKLFNLYRTRDSRAEHYIEVTEGERTKLDSLMRYVRDGKTWKDFR